MSAAVRLAMPTTTQAAAGAVVVVAAFAVWLLGPWSYDIADHFADDVAMVVVALIPAVFAVLTAGAAHGRLRVGWASFAVGLLAWAMGSSVWSFLAIVDHRSFGPNIADGFFLVLPVATAAALLLLWNRTGTPSGRVLLDGLIVAGSLFAVSWVLVISRLYEQRTTSRLAFGVLVAYPILDVAALTVATLVLVSAPAAQRLPLTLLTLGLAAMWASDGLYSYLSMRGDPISARVLELGWVVAMAVFTVAGAAGRTAVVDEHPPDQLPGWASVWLPYLPLMLAAGVLASSPMTLKSSRPILLVGVVLVIAVLMRQFLVVDQNRRLLAAVAEQARRDPLTGLANRTLFADRLDRAMASGTAAVGVVVIDLDDFKTINDTLGHAAGDALLIETARRIASGVRSTDTVARLGGDEFAVLLHGDAGHFAAVAHRITQAFDEHVVIGGQRLRMRLSLGLAIAGARSPGLTPGELLNRADRAMYAAKRSATTRMCTDDGELTGQDADADPPHATAPVSGREQHSARIASLPDSGMPA